MLLGVGLDNDDGHGRVTRGENFRLVGGSHDTHQQMQERGLGGPGVSALLMAASREPSPTPTVVATPLERMGLGLPRKCASQNQRIRTQRIGIV